MAQISNSGLQQYCNAEGTNLKALYNDQKIRIGIIANETNDCDSHDSFIGIGADFTAPISGEASPITAGNWAPSLYGPIYNSAGVIDNTSRNIPVWAFVWVRWDGLSMPCRVVRQEGFTHRMVHEVTKEPSTPDPLLSGYVPK